MLLECFSKNYSGNKKKKKEYSGGKILSCIQNKKRQKKALPSFVTMIWVGLVMNKWVCFGGEAPHAQSDGGTLSPGALCWGMMQYKRSPWLPQMGPCLLRFFFFSPPHNACSCVRCVAMQTSPAATVKISMEEVWTPSRLKGEEGDRKQSEREEGRSVDRQETCSFICSSLSFWCIN